jgi:hypothetical protein
MFANAQEMLAYTYEGRQLRVPEDGSWISFDCTACGAHNEQPIHGGPLECDGCDAYAPIPAEWSQDA